MQLRRGDTGQFCIQRLDNNGIQIIIKADANSNGPLYITDFKVKEMVSE